MNYKFDVVIIGAGVTGAFIARNLAKYDLSVALLEKENDVGNVTSSANSAIIHSGYDPLPGTNKAKFNVLGNAMYDQIADELDVDFERNGSLTIALNEEQMKELYNLQKRSEANGVDVQILNKEEVFKKEPNLSPDVVGALYAPTAGIIDPFNLVIHCVENAVDNGVKLFLNSKVNKLTKNGEIFEICTDNDVFNSKIVINAAGYNADIISSLIYKPDWEITPRKGEYYLLDKLPTPLVKHTIFQLPTEKGKGVLVTKTTAGEYLVGPSSELVEDRDDHSCDKETLANVKAQGVLSVPNIPFNKTVRIFAGNRPTCTRHDFVIEYAKEDDHFINCGGIESPGLVSAPAIGLYVVETLVRNIVPLNPKKDYNPRVKHYTTMSKLSLEEKNEVIKNNPDFGIIVCNCMQISLGEIKETLSRSVPPTTVNGIKRRLRPTCGPCQGSFCRPKITMILADYFKKSPTEIYEKKQGGYIVASKIKGE